MTKDRIGVNHGWLVCSGLTTLLAQKGYIMPRIIQNWWYKLISLTNEIRDFGRITIRKIRVLVIFLSNGLTDNGSSLLKYVLLLEVWNNRCTLEEVL